MLGRLRRLVCLVGLLGLLLGISQAGMAFVAESETQKTSAQKPGGMEERVRHELVMLPFYGVFDTIYFELDDAGMVTLSGSVTRPSLKSQAEVVVLKVQGVTKVANNIEVLPTSPMDDRIRLAVYRAIFSRPGFEKYAFRATSPIHIVVKNGNITLDGFVGSRIDKIIAEMAARSVPLTFAVTNNLTIG